MDGQKKYRKKKTPAASFSFISLSFRNWTMARARPVRNKTKPPSRWRNMLVVMTVVLTLTKHQLRLFRDDDNNDEKSITNKAEAASQVDFTKKESIVLSQDEDLESSTEEEGDREEAESSEDTNDTAANIDDSSGEDKEREAPPEQAAAADLPKEEKNTTTHAVSGSSNSTTTPKGSSESTKFPYDPLKIGGDPSCRLGFPSRSSGERKDILLDQSSLGPCVYSTPKRVVPKHGGWLNDVDFMFHNRPVSDWLERREACLLECLRYPYIKITPDLLTVAATMGLTNVTQYLLDEHNMDPLYNNSTGASFGSERRAQFVPNPIQAAIMGGYAHVVKILTKSDNDFVVDGQGRTVRDYVGMKASPIRPQDAKDILGITLEEEEESDQKLKDSKFVDPWNTTGHGWNSTTTAPVSDEEDICDLEIIDTSNDSLPFDNFLHDVYLTGRPVVMRTYVPERELRSFSKQEWSKLKYFHPNKTTFTVGPTAYPSLTNQSICSSGMILEEIEADARCPDFPEIKMIHAEHDRHFVEAFRMYENNDPTLGSFDRIREWYGTPPLSSTSDNKTGIPNFLAFKPAWQIFFGGDGSGATLHWHAAALNMLYVGAKEWQITPPYYRGFTGMSALQVSELLKDKPYVLKCTQRPGDLIYIPDNWGHMTINHGFGIGVAAIVGQQHRNVPGSSYNPDQIIKHYDAASGGDTDDSTPLKPSLTEESDNREDENKEKKILFVHINKAGGSSMIQMLNKNCKGSYQQERWELPGSKHRTFHCTAHSHIEHYGADVWNKSYTFAIVRHPLARQVSNFFFLLHQIEMGRGGDENDRLIPADGSVTSDSSDEVKIAAFHDWIELLYEAHPPHSEENYLFGSKGHGNEVYSTFNATQSSWMVDETGQDWVVQEIFKLEELSLSKLSQSMQCLSGVKEMRHSNPTPSYPHFTKFQDNPKTNQIMKEVFAVDYANFGYELPK